MRKLFLTLLTCLILLSPDVVMSETMDDIVEVYLLNQLDDHRGYCIDIKGYKSRAKTNRGVQAHTCYSYEGSIAIDQSFDRKRIMNNEFFLSGFNVCMEVLSVVMPGSLSLKNCNLGDAQKLYF